MRAAPLQRDLRMVGEAPRISVVRPLIFQPTVSAVLTVGSSHPPVPTARRGSSVLSFLHIGAEQSVDAGLIAWPLPSIPFHHIAVDP